MTWFKVDDGFWSHKKVMAIPAKDRPAAIGLWTMAASWCASQLEDGKFPKYLMQVVGGTQRGADWLVKVGLWIDKGDYYLFHDWARWQSSRKDVESKREKEADRKRRWRERRAAEMAARDGDVPTGQTPDGQRDSAGTERPVPLPETDPETDTYSDPETDSDTDPINGYESSSSNESNARALYVVNGSTVSTEAGDE